MTQSEFKFFGKILHIGKLYMSITQKIHGSNAQIHIQEHDIEPFGHHYTVHAGSRTRWLTPEDDNYGFCKWVYANRQELIEKLGVGRHYGEWAGPGINSGEGLAEKTLVLFNWRRWIGKELPKQVTTVPLLYKGVLSVDAINSVMARLKESGSFLVPSFMKPEGCVIEIDGQFYKNVFDAEEVRWKESTRIISDKISVDISYLLQPMRLEKLLSRDEAYIRDYPKSLGKLCGDYVKDLEDENQFVFDNEDALKLQKKALGREIFYFVKTIVNSHAGLYP